MYRLRVVPIFIPPLRERDGDVEVLLRFFLRRFNKNGPRHVETIAPDAMRALLNHRWPGNVRELRNVVEYAFAVGRGEELLLKELPPEFDDARSAAIDNEGAGERSERERIREALQLEGGVVNAAAKRLGMSRATFWRKRQKHGL
jgi:transcriptional regulator with PAS, ATPase and Fis domain